MYKLSRRSFERLKGVHSDLALVVCRAIMLTSTDFGVYQGLRSIEEQRRHVANGVSQTLESKHLTGDAVDLVAYSENVYRKELGYYVDVAYAIQQAAEELKVPVIWGACWQPLGKLTDLQKAISDYQDRKRSAGKKPFVDAGHFERG